MARAWVYVVLHEDRHTDVEPYVFTYSDGAVEFAKELAEELTTNSSIEEEEIDGWLYFATYSVEGDSVRVQMVEVNEHAPDK